MMLFQSPASRRDTLSGRLAAAERSTSLIYRMKPKNTKNGVRAKITNSARSKPVSTSGRLKRITPISNRRAVELAIYNKIKPLWWRVQVLMASDGVPRCQVPGCFRPASKNPSHRYGRIGSLLCEYRLWDRLCKQHYRWPEDNPKEAIECGLAAPYGQKNTNPFK
jgi:hypothetical protein